MGALSYEPISELALENAEESLSIAELGLVAQAFFDGQTTDVLAALIAAGSSGGARPKAQLYLQPGSDDVCSTRALANTNYLVKFTSSRLALGHEEGLCEAAYLTLAKKAGIEVPHWRLSPFYDVTFSPSPYGEHATAFAGYGKQPPLKAIQQLARHANYDSSAQIRQVIAEVIDSLHYFTIVAREQGGSKDTCKLISQQLSKIY